MNSFFYQLLYWLTIFLLFAIANFHDDRLLSKSNLIEILFLIAVGGMFFSLLFGKTMSIHFGKFTNSEKNERIRLVFGFFGAACLVYYMMT
jgi:hypothetical protein